MATTEKKRVAVADFSHAEALDAALGELSHAGIECERLCLLARKRAISMMAGDVDKTHLSRLANDLTSVGEYGDAEPLLASPGRGVHHMLSSSPDGRSIAESLSTWIPTRQSKLLELYLKGGAVLLWVCVSSLDLELTVPEILLRHSSHAVQVHEISQ